MKPFFVDPQPELEGRLQAFLDRMGRDAGEQADRLGISALVLGGGYGRGEGGVFDPGNREPLRFYNDLEFYLFTRTSASEELRRWVHRYEKQGSEELGVPVEIRLLPLAWIERSAPSMFLYDLIKGHQVVFGPTDLLEAGKHGERAESANIPLHEATRLLFNRGSGLLFSGAMLAGVLPHEDEGFIQRNHAKLRLALGDAILVANRQYHWSCRKRAVRVLDNPPERPPMWEEIRLLHGAGVAFKLRPRHDLLDEHELKRRQEQLRQVWASTFLWIESKRLGQNFADLKTYSKHSGRILPEFPAWKNVLMRVRDWARYRQTLPHWTDYPRGVLQRALAEFLAASELPWRAGAAARLGSVDKDPAEALRRYRTWWARYN
ncbi:MAG: hypothetical protein JO317_02580 [Verrucomicrobiae bacterium]|nr:hypothetical protein [Verrucomicrobiae bacterium]